MPSSAPLSESDEPLLFSVSLEAYEPAEDEASSEDETASESDTSSRSPTRRRRAAALQGTFASMCLA